MINPEELPTPLYISSVLMEYGFKPEIPTLRQDFLQWRRNVGGPLEEYADVYKTGEIKLYTRTGIINFPTGQRPNYLSEKFEGKITSSLDLSRLLLQVGFIKRNEFLVTQNNWRK